MNDASSTALWRRDPRTARPGARVIFRTAADERLLPGRVPDDVLGAWRYEDEPSQELAPAGPVIDLRRLPPLHAEERARRMSEAAALMDQMYRRQRHIYDLSRKFYLLGRDEAIARLRPAPGDTVLEIGCGTGRNLVKLAQTYPEVRLFGLDVSREMLATAAASTARAGLASRITFAQADATAFDPQAAVWLRKFRARDDLICFVDDPALA